MYFVYIIESGVNGKYYIGQTADLTARMERHNKGRNRSTKAYVPWRLRWWKEFGTRSEAVKVEAQLKALKKRTVVEKFVEENDFRGIAQSGPVPQQRNEGPRSR